MPAYSTTKCLPSVRRWRRHPPRPPPSRGGAARPSARGDPGREPRTRLALARNGARRRSRSGHRTRGGRRRYRAAVRNNAVHRAAIFAAPDVRTVGGTLPTGGTATLVFSRDEHAGVLVMNNVPPPSEGTVYQMWLIGSGGGATSAGTMDAAAVAPSTTAVLPELGDSTELAFTVEPGTGSTQPTGEVFARLALT